MKENKYLNEKGECNCPKPTFWINGIGRVAYNDQNRFHAEMLEKADEIDNADLNSDEEGTYAQLLERIAEAQKLRDNVKKCLKS
jgi:hypothetical protein